MPCVWAWFCTLDWQDLLWAVSPQADTHPLLGPVRTDGNSEFERGESEWQIQMLVRSSCMNMEETIRCHYDLKRKSVYKRMGENWMGDRQKIKPEPSLIFENDLMIKRREQINLTEWHKRRKDFLEHLRFCYSNHYLFSLLLLLLLLLFLVLWGLRKKKKTQHLTLLMCSGAWSGVLLNSPPIWRSLTQQIESLSSVSFWLPNTSIVWYGLCSLCYKSNGK